MTKAIVTGATGDIGSQIVRRLTNSGMEVVGLFHHNETAAQALSFECGCSMLALDFSGVEPLPDLSCDVLVNNAGVNITDQLCHEIPLDAWTRTLEINLIAAIRLTLSVLPGMVERRRGRIINISSIYGLHGSENNGPYNVSKHGLSGFTKSLAREYGQFGISANEVCPGPVKSKLLHSIVSRQNVQSVEDYLSEIVEEIPSGRLAVPDDIAEVVQFLAESKNNYINGTSLVVDGGMIS